METDELIRILEGVDDSDLELIQYDSDEDSDFELDLSVAERIHNDNVTLSEEVQGRQSVSSYDDVPWSTVCDGHPQINSFDEFAAGIQECSLNGNSREIDFFKHFVDEELVSKIVQYTNEYHNYVVLNIDLRQHSRIHDWRDVTIPEMYLFLAITMLMTRNRHLSIEEHWSRDLLLAAPIFGKLMSRNRYCSILGMIHFSELRLGPYSAEESKLSKVKYIIDHARNKFKSSLVPYTNLCIDESVVPFKGRLKIKQFQPRKRNRFGIKMFVLCDVKTHAIIDFIVYTGAQTDINDDGFVGKSGAVVTTLLKDYFGSYRKIYVDNWYTSPKLFKYLISNGIYACGTVNKRRQGMPKFDKKLKKGEIQAMYNGPLMALKWFDKKQIHMLSTLHDASMGPTNKLDETTGLPKMKPECIIEYNKNMGTVDMADMMLSSLQMIRKSVKWYKKLAIHIIDMHTLNAYYFFKILNEGSNIKFSSFQINLIRQLVEKYKPNTGSIPRNVPSTSCPTKHNPVRLLAGDAAKHMPAYIPGKASLRCKMPKHDGVKKRKDTRYKCTICNVSLCVVPCFRDYHEKKKV